MTMADPAVAEHWVWRLYEMGLTLIPLGTAGEKAPPYLVQRHGSQEEADAAWPKTARERWADWQRFDPPESQITEWILKYPGCNFAAVTGKQINVVDADDEAAIEFVQNNLTRTPWMVRTGKGAHFYYQTSPSLIIKNSSDRSKIDTRGVGGYVVAPGSAHISGRRYELEIDPAFPVDSIHDLPVLTGEDLQKINAYREQFAAPAPAIQLGQGTSLNFDARQFAPGQEQGVAQGSRDDNMTRLVGKWIQQGLSLDQVMAKAKHTDQGNAPPLGEANLLKIIQSVSGTHLRNNEVAPAPPPIQKRGLLIPPSQLQASAPSWIIKGVMPSDSIGVLFGPSSGGKSFAAIDMALCIASGRDWHGRKLKRQGCVIYVCGEGQQGIANRFRAWEQHHGVSIDNLPILITTVPVRMLDREAKQALIDAVTEAAAQLGMDATAIFIDTLNRNFGDGDENSTKDMTSFVDAVTDLHKATCATVLIVHHTGLTDADRARGNGSLKNACDFEIKHGVLSQEGDPEKVFSLIGNKMKDGSEMPQTSFKLVFVPLGVDEDGDEYGSCVIEQVPGDATEGAAIAETVIKQLGKTQRQVVNELAAYRASILTNKPESDEILIERQELVTILKDCGMAAHKTSTGISRLVNRGFLEYVNGVCYHVTDLVEEYGRPKPYPKGAKG